MSSLATLIVSEQPLVAALLAMLVELAGHRPQFALPGERLEEMLQRAPLARIALLDERHPASSSDLFFARAARRRVEVILFGPAARREELAAAAAARSVQWMELPIETSALARVLEAAERGTAHGERRRPAVERTSTGELIYLDREGARWYVYDRRVGGDRRRTRRGDTQRLFLNEFGEMWRYRLPISDAGSAGDTAAEALEKQLARAEWVCVKD